jgi:hypothetical protein
MSKTNSSSSTPKKSHITDYKLDQYNLCNSCQMHGCIGYCMYHQTRQTNTKDNKNETKTGKRKFPDGTQDYKTNVEQQHKRFCRFGAGYEEAVVKEETPVLNVIQVLQLHKKVMGLLNTLYLIAQETQDVRFKRLFSCHRFG